VAPPLAADVGFTFADPWALGLTFLGLAVFAAIGALSHEHERAFSASLIYLGLGVVAAVALALAGADWLDPLQDTSLVEHVVVPLIRSWRPQLVLVSAGFDAHRADPLATLLLSEAGFAAMTASLRRACAEVSAPLGLVLEGGYAVDALAASMAAVVPVLGAPAVPAVVDVDPHPLALAALERLAPSWPQLGSMRRM